MLLVKRHQLIKNILVRLSIQLLVPVVHQIPQTNCLLYFMLFQLAVYNKQTLPMNSKITGKNSVENGMQLVIEMLALFLPLALVAAMVLLFDDTTAYWTLIVIGLMFTITHPFWLRNVYSRMMKRKYENLEGFHASR